MALFKNTFTMSGEGAVASYDALDITRGSAIQTFYGADHGSNTKILYPQVVHSSIGVTESATNTALDIDFDSLIDVPLILEGKAVIVVPNMIKATSGAGNFTWTVTAYVRKYSGVTETTLDSEAYQFSTVAVAGANQGTYKLAVLGLDLPYTKFKAGDYLRVTITTSAQADSTTAILHDPEGRDVIDLLTTAISGLTAVSEPSWSTAVLKALLPVVIDL